MRSRFSVLLFLSLTALVLVAGCERSANSPFTSEDDDSDYRRGQDLLRQGRDQEALAAFQEVIERRGGDAPESHLDLGILYQQHIKDPIAAIYHYRKFLELQPNSPQADLVRQRIDAAMREFASTLPAQPLGNQMERLNLLDKLAQLQTENTQLRARLGGGVPGASFNLASRPVSPVAQAPAVAPDAPGQLAVNPADSPIAPAPAPAPASVVPAQSSPLVSPQRPPGNVRQYTIVKGDTLFSLSMRYYKSKSRWKEIYEANRDVMKSQNDLKIGMVLKIPQ